MGSNSPNGKYRVRDDQHGTGTGYAYGCRCDDCRSAQAERMREYAARRRNMGLRS